MGKGADEFAEWVDQLIAKIEKWLKKEADIATEKALDEIEAIEKTRASSNKRTKVNGDEFFTAIDKVVMEKWMKFLKARGVKFEIGTKKAINYLDMNNSTGLVDDIYNSKTRKLETTVFLLDPPSTGTFLEECYHSVQREITKVPQFQDITHNGVRYESIDYWEYQAKTKVLQNQKTNGICAEEIQKFEEQIIDVLLKRY